MSRSDCVCECHQPDQTVTDQREYLGGFFRIYVVEAPDGTAILTPEPIPGLRVLDLVEVQRREGQVKITTLRREQAGGKGGWLRVGARAALGDDSDPAAEQGALEHAFARLWDRVQELRFTYGQHTGLLTEDDLDPLSGISWVELTIANRS